MSVAFRPALSRNTSFLFGCAAAIALVAASAPAFAGDEDETIVITGTKFNTDAAPAKASLETTEPQTIINRSYIENFVNPHADYVTILSIVPGMTGQSANGMGLDDGGAKNSMRGIGDGNFVMQYDGIPFGDTNGPSHHNISYFPASTIGSAVVDRGPGNAGNLGAATYGGTVKLFSEALTDDMHGWSATSAGSFRTYGQILDVQTGLFDFFGPTRALVTVQALTSDGALSHQNVESKNATVKVEHDLSANWTVTFFGSVNFIKEHLDDNNGLTPAQIAVYGKNFALQAYDPNLPTYYAYNTTTKQTDMEYLRVKGHVTDTLTVDNQAYTYAYWNHTASPNSQSQTLPQIQADTSADNGTLTLLNGTKLSNQLLGYNKQNAFRVSGDIFRLNQEFNFGWLSGELRTGVWLEEAETHRFRYYMDSGLCYQDGIDFWSNKLVAAQTCGVVNGKLHYGNLGYTKMEEWTFWQQYEPFAELELHPIEGLTLTPGVKYIHWNHQDNSPIAQGPGCGVSLACPGFNTLGQNFDESFVTRETLPFFQANYKITRDWSAYFEYAKGVYVPDIGAFEAGKTGAPTRGNAFPPSELTTNYQFGTVFYADNFTFDADVYDVQVSNNYSSLPCPAPNTGETCFTNTGKAAYRGIEAEGTYAVNHLFGLDTEGLSVFGNGALMSSKSNGLWLAKAPKWTAAAGVFYNHEGWKFSIIDKLVGPQYEDNAENPLYKLPAYSLVNLSAGYNFGVAELELNVDNVLDSRKTISISEGGTGTSLAASTDQYFFQAPLSVTATVKVHF